MKPAACHPERRHYALGQCLRCYFRDYRATAKRIGVRLAQNAPASRR